MTSFLWNWVLTASLLIAAVLLLRAVFGKRISARLRYALWALALVRLLVPGQFYTAPVETPQVLLEARLEQALPGIPAGAPPNQGPGDGAPVQILPASGGAGTAPDAPVAKSIHPLVFLGWAWLTGSAVVAAAFIASNVRFARRLRRVREPLDVGNGCPLRVYQAAGLPSPCLFGVLRPAVYVTPEAAENPIMLRHVLAHEATHFRHGDHVWPLLRCAALAVHWWNPLVWLAAVLSRRDAELACDEGTLKVLGDNERKAYGNTLLALVASKPQPGGLLYCATTMTGGKRSLRERVVRIARAPERWLWAAVLAAALAVLVCACSFAGAKGPEAKDGPLTAEELQIYNNKIFNGDAFNIRNQFLFLACEAPQDIRQTDLYQLFYNGTGEPVEITEEERQAVADAAWDGEDPGLDLVKCPAGKMDEILQEYLGLSLEETDKCGLDQFTYLPEYDAYYTFQSDTNYPGNITFAAGERKDGKLLLYYQGDTFPVLSGGDGSFIPIEDFGWACVTLEEQKDGGFHFLTNWHCDQLSVSAASEGLERTPQQLLAGQLTDGTHDAFLVETGGRLGTLLVTAELSEETNDDLGSRTITFFIWNPAELQQPIQILTEEVRMGVGPENHMTVDANFDGFQDFAYLYDRGNQPVYWHFWLWNEAQGYFEEYPPLSEISQPEFFPQRQLITGWERSSASTGTGKVYGWLNGGLSLLRKAELDGSGEENATIEEYLNGIFTKGYKSHWDWDGEDEGKSFSAWLTEGIDVLREGQIRKLTSGQFGKPAELHSFQFYFMGNEGMGELHNGLLRAVYDRYQDIGKNLKIILYDQGEPITDEAERQEAAALCGGLEYEHTKFTTQHLRECLEANFLNPEGRDWLDFDVDLEEILGPYSEKYDTYYMEHSDSLHTHVRFDYGEIDATGTVRLYYSPRILYRMEGENCDYTWDLLKDGDITMCATLVPNPKQARSWRMVSNSIVE